jgi:hypothetical protein
MEEIQGNEIALGGGASIGWIPFDSSMSLFDMDELLRPTLPFWEALELHCMADCCGIDAFSFGAEDLHKAATQVGDAFLPDKLRTMRAALAARQELVFSSTRLNQLLHREMFLRLLDHVISHL